MLLDNNSRLNKFLGSVYVNAVVALIAVFRFFQFGLAGMGSNSQNWQAYQLCSNYSYGFIKRSLLGSLVKILASVTGMEFKNAVNIFMIAEEVIFSFVFLGFLFYIINKYKNPNLNLLILFFLSTDILGFYYWDWGEQDIILIALSIVMCLMIVREKFVWAVPFIVSACVLIHEGFAMMYFGMIVGLLLIKCLRKEKRERLKYFIILMATGLMCGGFSAYCYFCTKYVINVSPEQMVSDAVSKLGESVNTVVLVENFWNVGPRIIENGVPTTGFWLRMFAIALACVILSPFIVYKVRFWRELIKGEQSKLMKLAYLFCSLVCLLALPLILLQADETRWVYGIIIQEVMLIVFLYMLDEEKIKNILGKVLKTNVLNIILIGFYLIVFNNPNKEFIDIFLVIIPYVMDWGPLL